jgi:hypothetical protein
MATLNKVRAGDPLVIPAQTFNAFVDAATDFQNRQLGRQRTERPNARDSNFALIKNASGADRARFEILGIETPVIGPADNLGQFLERPALAGVVPTAAHTGRFAILAEPVANGALGWAWLSGVCPVRINVVSADHWQADVADGSAAHLQSGSGAAQILWKDAGTAVRWAVVRFGSAAPGATGQTLARITGHAGTASPYIYSGVQVEHDGGTDFGVDHFTTVASGETLTWKLHNAGELGPGGIGVPPLPNDSIVAYFAHGTGFMFVALNYRGTYL